MLDIHVESDFSALMAQRQAWEALAAGNVFHEPAWLTNWWAVYGARRTAFVITARDACGRLVGMLPLYRDHRYGQSSTLRAMGDGEVCSDYTSVIARPEHAPSVAQAMADWLLAVHRDPQMGWNTIVLDGVVADDPAVAVLLRQTADQGALIHQAPQCNIWRRPLTDSWDEHLRSLSKSRRRRTRRMCDQLDALEPDGPRVVETPDQLHHMLCVLEELHQLRWAAAGQPGCFSSERFCRFVRAIAADYFAQQRLRLCWLQADGRPLAAELQIMGGGVLYCYTAGMDPDARQLQAGHLLNISTARWAFQSGIAALDFLRGDEPYKESWRAVPHQLTQCRIVAPSLVPWVQHQTWRLGHGIKGWLKRHAPAVPANRTLPAPDQYPTPPNHPNL